MIILNELPYIYYLLKRLYSGNEKGKKKPITICYHDNFFEKYD